MYTPLSENASHSTRAPLKADVGPKVAVQKAVGSGQPWPNWANSRTRLLDLDIDPVPKHSPYPTLPIELSLLKPKLFHGAKFIIWF